MWAPPTAMLVVATAGTSVVEPTASSTMTATVAIAVTTAAVLLLLLCPSFFQGRHFRGVLFLDSGDRAGGGEGGVDVVCAGERRLQVVAEGHTGDVCLDLAR